MKYCWIILLIVLMHGLMVSVSASGESSRELLNREEKYVRRLREAGLFEIVEGYLTRKLNESKVPDDLRTVYVLELGRTLADHATLVSGPSQQLFWEQANEILTRELQEHPENPFLLQIRVEQICLPAVKIEYYCKVLELVADADLFARQVSAEGTRAIVPLEVLLNELTEQIKLVAQAGNKFGIKVFQLQALDLKIKYELARLHLNLASLNTQNQVEFSLNLIQAEKFLKQLTAGWTEETLTQQAWVQLARLNRLKKDLRGFQIMKKALEPVEVPDFTQDQITAEEVQLNLHEGKLLEAEQIARERLQFKQEERKPAAELIVWHLQSLKKLADLAESKANQLLADDLRKQIQIRQERFVLRGEQYWIDWLKIRDQRQELNLQKVPELAQMVLQAEKHYQAGEFNQAAALYRQLYLEALKRNKKAETCEWGYTSLSILAKQQDWAEVVKLAGEIYPGLKESEKANEIHFLWLFAEHQLLSRPWQKTPAMEQHVARLEEHLTLYGSESTASRVRFFLAMIGEQLGMHDVGVRRFYLQVDPQDTQYQEAIKQACKSLFKTALKSKETLATEISAEWEKSFTPVKKTLLEKNLSLENVETQLELIKCEILCAQLTNESVAEMALRLTQIEQYLHNVGVSTPKSNETAQDHELMQQSAKLLFPELQATKCLLIFSTRDMEKVNQQIHQLGELRVDLLLELIQSMGSYSQRWGNDRATRFQVSKVQLPLIKQLNETEVELTSTQQQILFDIKIEALSQTGQYAEARKLLEQELGKNPERSSLAEKLVVMYFENGSPQSLDEAALLIKKLETKQKAGSNDWLKYRLLLLETGIKQNKKEETKKLWQLTKVLYPKAGSDEQKKKLLELGKKLK